MFSFKPHFSVLLVALTTLTFSSCKHDQEPAPAPTAAFEFTGGACQGGCPVTFRNTSANAKKYTWAFSDNTTGSQAEAQFQHTYAQPGVYQVRLTVEGDGGANTTSRTVTVGAATCTPTTVQVTGTLAAATIWEPCTVYVVNGTVSVKAKLTIQAGTVVKFKPGSGLLLSTSGSLESAGTATAPVFFTSYRDDAHGGDTNQDGTTSAPARKDWIDVNLNGTSGSTLTYSQFLYGGSGGTALDVSTSAPSITNCTFAYNGDDVAVNTEAALNAHYATAGTIIRNNVFYGNVRPLSITSSLDLDDSNSFNNPLMPTEKNQYQGIVTYWDTNVTKANVVWEETELAYVNTHNVDLRTSKTLRLGNNVTVKFLPGTGFVFRDSPSQLLNSNGTGVGFTSFKDDTRGGDSNGNGAANAPATGDWEGVYHDVTSNFWLQWANAYYARH